MTTAVILRPDVLEDRPDLAELRELCTSLRAALSAEARTAGQHSVALGRGVRTQTTEAGTAYRFTLETPVDTESGTPAIVRLQLRDLEVTITRVADDAIDIVLPDDRGYAVDGAELRLGTAWLVDKLRDRVTAAFEVAVRAPSLYNLDLALLTLGLGEIQVATLGPVPEYDNSTYPLTEEQALVIATVFRSPVTLVPAAGGTGKTVTLGALVEACFNAGLRALVAAPTNKAVDLSMLQACHRLRAKPGFHDGAVVRVGSDAGPELREQYGADVILEDLSARIRAQLHQRIVDQAGLVDRLAAAMSDVQRGPRDDERERALRAALDAGRAKLRSLRREMRDFAGSVTAQARVVGATLSRITLDQSLGRFDVVIVDEISLAQPLAVFLAAGLGQRTVLAGDPCQLSAPVLSHDADSHWLKSDVFERLGVSEALREEEDVPYITPLLEQRRSAADLCEVQRELWYGPALRTSPSVIERERVRHNVVFGTAALCYIDTSTLDAQAYHPYGYTYANDEHAHLILDLVRYLDSAGEIPALGGRTTELLAMSHYRGQASRLRSMLRAYRPRGVIARTVHRSQGSEATTAVFDLTITRHQPARSEIMTATRPEESGSRLLCTALTRARSRFVFIGDMEWIERSVAPRSILGRLYTRLREDGYQIPVRELRGT
jgi:hypothetical protein